ncbi:MAG: hypothetical protein Q9198_006519 [Flavoplaca austrocitrina]
MDSQNPAFVWLEMTEPEWLLNQFLEPYAASNLKKTEELEYILRPSLCPTPVDMRRETWTASQMPTTVWPMGWLPIKTYVECLKE